MLTHSLIVIALAAVSIAAPTTQLDCATCPSADTDGNALVAASGGTPGVPKFCGYSADATGVSGPQTICFYGNGGSVSYNSNGLCPLATSVAPCQWPQ